VVITGTDFNGATSVLFGATAAAAFTVDSNTQITATSPAHALGLVDITVTTPSGTSAVVAADNFTFVAPEMDVTNGATAVADAGANDPLGNVPFGLAQTVTYTITNSGTAGLNLTGTPDLVVVTAGTNVTSATVTTVPASSTVAVAGTVTFTITYTVTAAGAFDLAVSIANDDADENPYTWTADGTGVLAPEMDVTRSGAIADGGTDAQAGAVAGTNIVLTYTIANNGNSLLTMTLPVTISGLVNCTATVTTAPATATVAAAANETFVVTLKPTAAGVFSASVSITNDDPNENPYNWTISGTATAAPKKKKKDEGGCSTGDTNNALLMIAGVMATLGLAMRLRRKTA
jgi:LPXTG-motif cell wall-anchored protein